MAILSKWIGEGDLRELTINEKFSSEPFPAASGGAMTVKDEQGLVWTFKYKVRSNKRVISGSQWAQFVRNNGVQAGHTIAFYSKDPWCYADYKVEVIR